ncbi:flagellar hook assembly protein FlgD [Elioraea rosea]|uniref:flagellar hook assembly protein FlgD n=1 Tax=Elioraea rosea TaxID=2492390 RepID=UPI0011860B3C|nr:flagellar hook capping FlgD N-terminal domain-containing protein [Elioraea rosea]
MTTIANTLSTADRAGVAQTASNRIANNFQDFLKLLTTQLQNQDPTAPLDTNQFTQQLVQFAQVEQQLATNSNLESLINLQKTAQLTALTPLLGRTVEIDGTSLPLQEGEAAGTYSFTAPVTESAITITNAAGRVVRTAAGETGAGTHGFYWDGKDNDGKTLPEGVYTIAVTGQTGSSTVQAATTVYGRVTGSERGTDGAIKLRLGDLTIDSDKIKSVVPD